MSNGFRLSEILSGDCKDGKRQPNKKNRIHSLSELLARQAEQKVSAVPPETGFDKDLVGECFVPAKDLSYHSGKQTKLELPLDTVLLGDCLEKLKSIPDNSNEGNHFNPVHFKSESVEWPTPRHVFRQLDREFEFTLDPCATHENATCARYFTKDDDGLKQDWSSEVVFMNPPYGREIDRWMNKAYQSSLQGATVVCLVPARTDTKWWHHWAMRGEIRLVKGRLRFGNAKNSAPFPSAIVVFKPPKAEEMKVAA